MYRSCGIVTDFKMAQKIKNVDIGKFLKRLVTPSRKYHELVKV